MTDILMILINDWNLRGGAKIEVRRRPLACQILQDVNRLAFF
jgi:hypothetical protein